jgi:hypothetical protein
MNKLIGITLFLSMFLAACSQPVVEPTVTQSPEAVRSIAPTNTEPQPTPTQKTLRLTIEQLRNAIYPLEAAANRQVKLVDGKYSEDIVAGSASKLTVDMTDRSAFGDLNGDGSEDAAVELAWNSGGSGTFHELAAVINQAGIPKVVALKVLGDRIVVKNMAIVDGVIVVDMLVQGPGDGMCCPKTPVTLRYKLVGDSLKPAGSS